MLCLRTSLPRSSDQGREGQALIRKYASFDATVLDAYKVPRNPSSRALKKAAHRIHFDYEPRPGYLYVRSRMISSRCNDNHDEFPAEEIKQAYATFIGKPVFVNHHNEDHRRARGVIIDAALHEDRNPDGSPDTWVEGLMEIDAKTFPKLAKAILAGEVDRTSMGTDVALSVCSACGNKATSPAEYCQHIPAMKGRRIFRVNAATGKREGHLVREICHGLKFFENSLLVEEPADPTAYFTGVDDRGLKTASRKTAEVEVHPQAACPSCGQKNFRTLTHDFDTPEGRALADRYNLPHHVETSQAICDNCGDVFDASKSMQANIDNRRADEMNRDQYVHERNQGDELYGNFTDKFTKPLIDWGETGEEQYAAERGGSQKINPRTQRPVSREQQQLLVEHSSPFKLPEGPMDPRKLSRLAQRLCAPPVDLGGAEVHQRPRTAAKEAAGPKWDPPSEHPFYQAHPVSHENVLSAYDEATPDMKKQGERWYPDAHIVAKALGKGDAALGAGVLAAYSPKSSWPVNLFNAAHSIERGKAVGPGEGFTAMGQHQRTAQKMIDGEHHSKVLKSPKISDFAHLIEHGGDDDPAKSRVVVDRHALSVAAGHRMNDDDLAHAPMANRHYYEHAADQFRAAAAIASHREGRFIPPHEMQATTWLVQQKRNQAEDEGQAFGGKGRISRDRNAWNRWDEYQRERHPGMDQTMHTRNPHAEATIKTGFGETKAPPQVDTLRAEECPVCGEDEVYDGERCPVCGFIAPPDVFRDPDLDIAKQIDLRQDRNTDDDGEVDLAPGQVNPNEPGGGLVDPSMMGGDETQMASDQLYHPDQVDPNGVPAGPGVQDPAAVDSGLMNQQAPGQPMDPNAPAPGTPDDGVPDLFCPACGSSFDAGAPLTVTTDPAQPTSTGLTEGSPCPNCGQATLISASELSENALGLPEPGTEPEHDDLADPDSVGEDGQAPGDEDGGAPPFGQDEDAGEEEPGPDEEEAPPGQEPDEGDQEDEDSSDDEDEDEAVPNPPNTKKGQNSRVAGHGQQTPRKEVAVPNPGNAKAASLQALAARLEQVEGQLSAALHRTATLELQNTYLARVAGLAPEMDAIRRTADLGNPASPVPDPPSQPAPESTEQALAPATEDDVRRPGETPGSVNHVPAEQVDVPMQPGVSLPTAPANDLIDVTAPTQGTETHIPNEQTRIETDVRVGDPMNPEIAFPWNPNMGGPDQQDAMTGGQRTGARTMAAMRLGRLRVQAGLAKGDELAVGASIEGDTTMSDQMINHEIATLSKVAKTASRQRPAGLVPRTASRERTMPSLAAGGAQVSTAPVGGDLDEATDLFV